MNNQEIEKAVQKLLATPELFKKIDRRLKYDLANQDKRTISTAKKLLALNDAGMLEIKEEI